MARNERTDGGKKCGWAHMRTRELRQRAKKIKSSLCFMTKSCRSQSPNSMTCQVSYLEKVGKIGGVEWCVVSNQDSRLGTKISPCVWSRTPFVLSVTPTGKFEVKHENWRRNLPIHLSTKREKNNKLGFLLSNQLTLTQAFVSALANCNLLGAVSSSKPQIIEPHE